jgi:hypothetical protein
MSKQMQRSIQNKIAREEHKLFELTNRDKLSQRWEL